ncbi:MAG: hypothetical protein AAF447_02945 [Myxococcota bacterium]
MACQAMGLGAAAAIVYAGRRMHFHAIGLPLEGPADLDALLETCIPEADALGTWEGSEHLTWTDASGAGLAIRLREGGVDCITPFFLPADVSALRVGPSRWHVDPGCIDCSGVDVDVSPEGDTITRSSVQLTHPRVWRATLEERPTYALRLAAFAHELAFFEDEAALLASRSDEEPSFAPNAFLPLGMFKGPEAPLSDAAIAMFNGTVDAVETRTNAGGGSFLRLRVTSMAGALDVVASPEQVPSDVLPGQLAHVVGWLVGEPALPRPEAPRKKTGLLSRFFG